MWLRSNSLCVKDSLSSIIRGVRNMRFEKVWCYLRLEESPLLIWPRNNLSLFQSTEEIPFMISDSHPFLKIASFFLSRFQKALIISAPIISIILVDFKIRAVYIISLLMTWRKLLIKLSMASIYQRVHIKPEKSFWSLFSLWILPYSQLQMSFSDKVSFPFNTWVMK